MQLRQGLSYSAMTATTTQDGGSNSNNGDDRDSDGDGIPDSSDSCTHNSNPRCFKEGDDSTTEQPSNRTGNQTR